MDNLLDYCRQKKFFPNTIFYDSLRENQIENIKCIIDKFSYPGIIYKDILDYDKVIITVHKSKNYELIDYIIELFGIHYIKILTFQKLLTKYDSKYLEHFLKLADDYNVYDTIEMICEYAKVNLLDIAMEKYKKKIIYNDILLHDIYISDDLNFVKYLHEKYLDNHCEIINKWNKIFIFGNVCRSNNIDIINYIFNKFNYHNIYIKFKTKYNPLLFHTYHDNVNIVDHIIKLIPNMNFDYINQCLLHCYGKKQILNYLENNYGNNIDFYKYYDYDNALTISCRYNKIEYVKYILDNHLCKDINKYFYKILMNSCQSGNIELIDYLYNRFPQMAQSLSDNDNLETIFKNIDLSVAKFLVNNFPEINLKKFVEYIKKNPYRYTKNDVINWINDGCKMPERKIKSANF